MILYYCCKLFLRHVKIHGWPQKMIYYYWCSISRTEDLRGHNAPHPHTFNPKYHQIGLIWLIVPQLVPQRVQRFKDWGRGNQHRSWGEGAMGGLLPPDNFFTNSVPLRNFDHIQYLHQLGEIARIGWNLRMVWSPPQNIIKVFSRPLIEKSELRDWGQSLKSRTIRACPMVYIIIDKITSAF